VKQLRNTWLVCGGRDFNDVELFETTMSELVQEEKGPPSTIVHGAARGADSMAGTWAKENRVRVLPFPAAWNDLNAPGARIKIGPYGPYNANAGFDRNQKMIDEGKPNLVVAFPGHGGTADMVARARKANVRVIEV
jgi:hypothetical protein